MSDAVKFAFLQATAPLCPDVQRKIWIWKQLTNCAPYANENVQTKGDEIDATHGNKLRNLRQLCL